MAGLSAVSEADVKVWVGTMAIWGALYGVFVWAFGSADGSKTLSEKDLRAASKEASAATNKQSGSRSSSRAAAKAVDYTKKEEPSSTEAAERAAAIEFAKEALPSPAVKKSRGTSAPRKRAESPAPAAPKSKSSTKKAAAAPASAAKKPRGKAKFEVHDLIDVAAHDEPGSKPRPGGVAKVTAVNAIDGAWTYDVTYILGGKQVGVQQAHCSINVTTAEAPKRASRPSQKRAAAAESEEEPVKRSRSRK